MKSTGNQGFSLVELIVVIAIMAILAAVAIPTFAHFITKANEAADIDFMNSLERAIVYANATESDTELVEIEITVNQLDGSIKKIKYTMRNHKGLEKVYPIDTESDSDLLSSLAIDWNYQFKAADSVVHHPHWDASWKITPYDPTE